MDTAVSGENVTKNDQIREYAGFSALARILSAVEAAYRPQGYRRQHIHAWWSRRASNGFPEKHRVVQDGKVQDLLNVVEVLEWKKSYVPYAMRRRNSDSVDS